MKSNLDAALIIADCHRPYHDKRAWDLVLQVGRWLKPHIIINNGDFADFYTISSHSKDPARASRLTEELADCNAGFDQLDALGAKVKLFIGGNHEDRLRRFIEEKAPELVGQFRLPDLFHLYQRGWHYTPYKAHTKLGKLHITHDVGTAGRYSTHKALDTYQHSVTTGHSHRLCYVVEGNAVGQHKLAATFGWLGDVKQADYMHSMNANKNWALGFGVGYVHRTTGIAYLVPVPIVKYTCVVNGHYFES